MSDRRQSIIEAGLGVLREHGYPGFTQQRVATAAGLRQSHLTYYYPTRAELLAAIARAAIERQFLTIDTLLDGATRETAAAAIAAIVVRHPNTRVLMALAQAADQEPVLRELFRELVDGVRERAGRLLASFGIAATDDARALLHALSVGIAVVDLAVGRPDGEQRARAMVELALDLLASGGKDP